ncbi:MAG TPA: FAD-dependent oxidoreductase, partial [Deltaproteobacteria bacterium]|nr:FAD-dependent oxidoreductase [Deltaproteobacteria bacterium]
LATRRALAAGFDGVEILSNTGYLINQFLSAVTNRRTDGYGGDLAGRMRFGLEVAEAVKSAAGREGMVIIRLGGNDFMPRGCTLNETLAFAAELQKKEVDAFSVTGGWHETRVPQLPMEVPRGCYAYLAREVKKTVTVPVIACNRINDPDLAERIIREKSADMAGMARGLIADPELPNKLVRGEKADIAACIGCNQGCFDHIFRLEPVGCMVNPRAGFEHVSPASSKTASPKRVVVVGGGPAGLSAAAEAAARGHRVELYEKSDTLGGQLNLAGALEERREFITLKNTLISKARRSGAVLHTGVEADRALLERLKPDAIILASGGSPAAPRIPGIDGANVVQAWDVLAGRADVGENVVIIGGGAVGIETGVFIAKMGTLDPHALHFLFLHQAEDEETLRRLCTRGTKKVKIIEMLPRLGKDIGMSTRWVEIQMLKLYGVQAVTGATVTAITENGVVVQTDGTEETIACDTVVTAVGTSPVNGLEQEAKSVCKEVYVTGDARSPRKAYEAIHEGFEAAAAIS